MDDPWTHMDAHGRMHGRPVDDTWTTHGRPVDDPWTTHGRGFKTAIDNGLDETHGGRHVDDVDYPWTRLDAGSPWTRRRLVPCPGLIKGVKIAQRGVMCMSHPSAKWTSHD